MDFRKLIDSSSEAARRSLSHQVKEDWDQFLIQGSMAIELLGKATLVRIHPSLIVDKDFDSLLVVSGGLKYSKRKDPWSIKTVGAVELLTRCAQVIPDLKSVEGKLRVLADLRNSVVHIGAPPPKEMGEILDAFLRGAVIHLEWLVSDQKAYFGEYYDYVQKRLDARLADVNKLVAGKIASAKSVFDEKYGSLESHVWHGIEAVVSKSLNPIRYEQIVATCPACGCDGLLSGTCQLEWDQFDEDDPGDMSLRLNAKDFNCPFCNLHLDGVDELKAAGLRATMTLEPEDLYDFMIDD
ncbi:MAG TPA: hypothetical protein VD973_19565 [Symbiobacteriaceae bacterium]|nr:hypothetical protein [Symbiobacteriaceae bacterium]